MPPAAPEQAARLAHGLQALGLAVDADAQAKLLDYVALLARWNRTYNLTAVRDPLEMVTRHLLDSLAVLPYLRGPRIVDVGTGAGLPGIPLAIAAPDHRYTLLDSNGKKTRFVTQAAAQLGLTQVEVVQARVEDYVPDAPFDTVVTRAFAELPRALAVAGHLCRTGGTFLAMKGAAAHAEAEGLPAGYRLRGVRALTVPGLDAQRYVVEVTAADPTA
ncbi:16S rRNA (guanine(527)-N(7))-methyltransferase RsmG [Ectothiorhodospiraceae bacterium 2226]|nr:16S rRNA (guanine(527)-N(7))-methyltransferase RsmG [Ectothiorhodospiraceae bacterium 2226]